MRAPRTVLTVERRGARPLHDNYSQTRGPTRKRAVRKTERAARESSSGRQLALRTQPVSELIAFTPCPDEIALKADRYEVDMVGRARARFVLRHVGAGGSPLHRARMLLPLIASHGKVAGAFEGTTASWLDRSPSGWD